MFKSYGCGRSMRMNPDDGLRGCRAVIVYSVAGDYGLASEAKVDSRPLDASVIDNTVVSDCYFMMGGGPPGARGRI